MACIYKYSRTEQHDCKYHTERPTCQASFLIPSPFFDFFIIFSFHINIPYYMHDDKKNIVNCFTYNLFKILTTL